MPKQLYTNNAVAPLAATITSGATTIGLGTGFANFATPTGGDYQIATITDGTNIEIIKITARSGSSLTVVRGQEGTTAQAWTDTVSTVSARITAGMLGRLHQSIGSGTDSTTVASGEVSVAPVASGTGAVAIGNRASASGTGAFAIGAYSDASGNYANAIGENSSATAFNATAIGRFATAQGASSFAGPFAFNYVGLSWVFGGHPVIPRDNFSFGGESTASMAGAEGNLATPYVDLGNIPPWASATAYIDGDVVRPTSDNGKQYHLWFEDYAATAIPNTMTSPGTEPTWPTSAYDSVEASASPYTEWICLDMLNGFVLNLPDNVLFFPTEFGFVCTKYANVTAAPYVSIGTAASPNLYVNNQQLTGITGALQIQRLTPLTNTAITELQFKLNTKATGTNSQFHGRFYAKGLFIQAQG